jgi:tetratricopeptide (TPR) repeat protein
MHLRRLWFVAILAWQCGVALAAMDIDALWDYADPALSESRFRAALDGVSAAERLELQTQIARTYSLRRRFDDAHRELDAAQAAPGAAEARVAVRLQLERGRSFNSAGEPLRARPLFEGAFERARAAGLDALAIDAAHMVAITYGDGDDALAWNRRGLALARASSDPAAQRWQVALLNNSAWALHDRGRYDEALELFEQALAAARRHGSARQVQIAEWSVARCLRLLRRYDEALARQRRLLDELLQRAGLRDGYVHEEVAENLLALGRADEARPEFALAASLLGADVQFGRREAARLARLRALGGVAP